MGNLLANGFHLSEVIDFLNRSKLVEKTIVEKMKMGLAAGRTLSEILEDLNFSKTIITQIALVDFHGNLTETLQLIEKNLRERALVQEKLLAVATYPVILLLFLTGITLGLKNYLLPQLNEKRNMATALINHLPKLFFCLILCFIVLIVLSKLFFQRKSALWGAQFLTKLPLISGFVRLYLSAYFAREWGNLIAQGVGLQRICRIMQEQRSRVFSEVGQKMTQELTAGGNLSTSVKRCSIFQPELSLMIEYGEIKNKLGLELLFYAAECWERFFSKINRAMQFIQPLIFIFVALMIVLLYAAMLLPIYSNMSKMM